MDFVNDELLEKLRARYNDIESRIAELHVLKQEQANIGALLKLYDRKKIGGSMLPHLLQNAEDKAAALASFPRIMANTVRRLLHTDVGPTATVPELYEALPDFVKQSYTGPNDRSNIETLRTQIITWKNEAGLTYEKGGVVGLVPDRPFGALYKPTAYILRDGFYRCHDHPETSELCKVGDVVPNCSIGGPDCMWEFAEAVSP